MDKLNHRAQDGVSPVSSFDKSDHARKILDQMGLTEQQFCKFNGLKDLSEMTEQQYFNLVQNHGGH